MEIVFPLTALVVFVLSVLWMKRLKSPAPRRMIREKAFDFVFRMARRPVRKVHNEDCAGWKVASRDLLALRVEGLRKYDPLRDLWVQ